VVKFKKKKKNLKREEKVTVQGFEDLPFPSCPEVKGRQGCLAQSPVSFSPAGSAQGSSSSPCLGPRNPHSMGICFLGEFFIAKYNYRGNCTVVWHFLQNTSSFRGREKKGSFVKAKEESWREGFLLFILMGNME